MSCTDGAVQLSTLSLQCLRGFNSKVTGTLTFPASRLLTIHLEQVFAVHLALDTVTNTSLGTKSSSTTTASRVISRSSQPRHPKVTSR